MTPAEQILPPPPARRPRAPRPSPAAPVQRAPARDRRPEAFPPPVLDALAAAAEWLALCGERADDAVEHQDADPNAEWADLPEWMRRTVGADGNFRAEGLGVGESVNGHLVWPGFDP